MISDRIRDVIDRSEVAGMSGAMAVADQAGDVVAGLPRTTRAIRTLAKRFWPDKSDKP